MSGRIIIGWREWAALPELGVDHIKAKVDTGAKTSCVHAFNITPFKRDGEEWVKFDLHPKQHKRRPVVKCEAKVTDTRHIRSSNGATEERYVIETNLQLGPYCRKAQLTLTNRDEMGFRMLIGRQALKGLYLVDASGSLGLPAPYETKNYG